MSGSTGARPRRFWVDPRFAVGIVLIVASVVGVWALLSVQNRTVRVYVARSTLVEGDVVHADDLTVASVRVPASDRYLAEGALPADAVVTRSVREGELVPAKAVSNTVQARLTSVVVTASGPVAASVNAGSTADVWAAHTASDKNYAPPLVLVSGAVVVSVSRDDALVSGRSSVSVELRVPASRVAAVLQAIADGEAISVVPTSADATAAASEASSAPRTATAVPTPTGSAG
ncbi:SAF domain-containing protein [Rathayibacter sp. CAU 1779]